MTKKKRERKRLSTTKRLEELLSTIVPDYTQRLVQAEALCTKTQEELRVLKDKLTSLLNDDQLEAAQICGCPPEVYAIEFVQLWKEKIFPSFPDHVKPFPELK